MANDLFSLQGKAYSAIRDPVTGKPGKLTFLGNVSKASASLNPNISKKYESQTGKRYLYGQLMKERDATFNVVFDELKKEALVLGLMGAAASIAGGVVAAEAFPAGLVAGDSVQLAHQLVTGLAIVDSAAAPLVAGVNYAQDPNGGSVVDILNVGAFVQPFSAAYNFATVDNITMMTDIVLPERYIVFDGVDSFTGGLINVHLFRVQFPPAKDFNLIDPDWGGLDLTGGILYDPINAAIANMGGFGRINKTPQTT